ncbi:hypothetical protein Avi_9917 [Allorhizobium ampelinum S4]|uniref:Uncharacterized protein n=2 Tax=Rhizobium/Agrobacterium group TaxID=227290 RepID=B9JZX8_ALLAM|nr:hypothetical protein Avi_9917 [Allorhizobium ampelinum S4]MUO31815.1 hypothetical protein [Agrobacterium vitis]MUO45747.1 hypothetical protein [Agrobacterium vitis]
MISMAYDLAKISMTALMRPAFDAGVALTRLDECWFPRRTEPVRRIISIEN